MPKSSCETNVLRRIACRKNCENERGVLHNTDQTILQPPESTDGFDLNRLVADSPPLDPNSVYCNLLQCSHFQDTCICAKTDGRLVGFVSGYILPNHPNTLFIWQVVVDEEARGQGLASRMLTALLKQPACSDVEFLETTITPDNEPSQALFTKLADRLSTQALILPGFEKTAHFHGQHESEDIWRIGPLPKQ